MLQNYAELLVDGHRVLPRLLHDIRRAQESIHVSVFLFFRDPIGEEIAAALVERARAGVKVRVLLNVEKTGMGDPFSTGEKRMMQHDPNIEHNPLDVKPLCERLEEAGASVKDTNIDYDLVIPTRDTRLQSVAAQVREGIAIDELHIDHRKLVVIDGCVAYTGGANFGAQYLHHVAFDPKVDARDEGESRKKQGLSEPWWKWHDSLTRFAGPVVPAIEKHFRERWILDGGDEYEPITAAEGSPLFRDAPAPDTAIASAEVFSNEPNEKPNTVRELYVRLIANATSSIFIENPYLYHPDIVEALLAAKRARAELRVVLVVPSGKHNDNAFSQDAQEHHYASYLEAGIEVYEYQNHFNHLKLAIFDERWSIHGSTNLNFRSLENDKDFELVVLVDDRELARRALEDVRDVDIVHSRRIDASDVSGTSLAAIRKRTRDPRTLLLMSRRVL